MNVGFIGAGKAGTAFGLYLARNGVAVSGFYDITAQAAERAATLANAAPFDDVLMLAKASSLIIISVPDGAIAGTWASLRDAAAATGTSLEGKIIAHLSGATASSVLEGAEATGALPCSIHPLLAMSAPEESCKALTDAHFSIEGNGEALDAVEPLLAGLGNSVHRINAADKVRYHAASVFASNLVIAPLAAAADLLASCGFSAEDARNALAPLVEKNIEAVLSRGPADALTGPAERADQATVAAHLSALDNDRRHLYGELTRAILPIAHQKNPERDYTGLESVLAAALPTQGDTADPSASSAETNPAR